MKLHISITTYDRPDGLNRLLASIEKNKRDHELDIFIYDDCSKEKIKGQQNYFRFNRNNGKKGYWRVIDRAFQDASQNEFDYFFLLQDDCDLVDDFFNKAINEWDDLLDRKKATLCTFTPKTVYGRNMWGGRAKDISFRGKKYINGGYVDCIFMCPRETLQKLSFGVLPVDLKTWDKNPNHSSGVGMQLTHRIREMDMTMFTCYSSLVLTGDMESKMNKEERKIHPLNHWIRDEKEDNGNTHAVFVGIASIPTRENLLYNTLKSLTNQVDKIYVALNGYTQTPSYAKEFDNVEFTLTTNEMGDANKFSTVDKLRGFFLSCDDDIIYPKDYADKMVNKIMQYGYNVIVTAHARTILKQPIKKFYSETQQHHFTLGQHKDINSHIPGTGVSAFHTDYVKFKYRDLEAPNMADIWLGIYAQKNNIPVICVERSRRWITSQTSDESIYKTYRDDDYQQVKLINSTLWK